MRRLQRLLYRSSMCKMPFICRTPTFRQPRRWVVSATQKFPHMPPRTRPRSRVEMRYSGKHFPKARDRGFVRNCSGVSGKVQPLIPNSLSKNPGLSVPRPLGGVPPTGAARSVVCASLGTESPEPEPPGTESPEPSDPGDSRDFLSRNRVWCTFLRRLKPRASSP